MASINTRVIFAKHPTEFPIPGEHLKVEKVHFDAESITLAKGDILIKALVLSLDPYMRGRMNPNPASYTTGFAINSVPFGHGIAEVIQSTNDKFKVGDVVYGLVPWEEYSHIPEKAVSTFKVYNHVKNSGLPLTYYVGVLGMPGMTAYIGLAKFAQPIKKGETLFVSAASGAVGQLVGQIAKLEGLRVIGSVGDDAKVDYILNQLHFDGAFNYKKHDTGAKLKELGPEGIDIYFENVGGKTLEHVLDNANNFGRIIVCGMISQYNLKHPEPVHNLGLVLFKRLKIEGFIWSDWRDEYEERFTRDVTAWLKEGKIVYKENVVNGIENIPQAFTGMLKGENFGKQVIKVADL